jgi:hypothetical protein
VGYFADPNQQTLLGAVAQHVAADAVYLEVLRRELALLAVNFDAPPGGVVLEILQSPDAHRLPRALRCLANPAMGGAGATVADVVGQRQQ